MTPTSVHFEYMSTAIRSYIQWIDIQNPNVFIFHCWLWYFQLWIGDLLWLLLQWTHTSQTLDFNISIQVWPPYISLSMSLHVYYSYMSLMKFLHHPKPQLERDDHLTSSPSQLNFCSLLKYSCNSAIITWFHQPFRFNAYLIINNKTFSSFWTYIVINKSIPRTNFSDWTIIY